MTPHRPGAFRPGHPMSRARAGVLLPWHVPGERGGEGGRDGERGAVEPAPAVDQVALAPVVDALCSGATSTFAPGGRVTLPSREAVIQVVEDLRSVLFPGYFGTSDLRDENLHYFIGATLEKACRALEEQVRRGPWPSPTGTTTTPAPTAPRRPGRGGGLPGAGCPRSGGSAPPTSRRPTRATRPSRAGTRRSSPTRASSPSPTSASPTSSTCSGCRSSRASSPSTPTP